MAGFSAIINVLMLAGYIYMMQVYDHVLFSASVLTMVGLFTIVLALYVFLNLYNFLRVAVSLDQVLVDQTYQSWLHSGVLGGLGKHHRTTHRAILRRCGVSCALARWRTF